MTITEPGIYDMPAADYLADPVEGGSLSASGARRLLPPSCPAVFNHERQHGRPGKAEFDFGHAAHKEVLGVGPDVVTIDAADYRTKVAQAARDEARAAGLIPVLAHEWATVEAMAAAIKAHPIASALMRRGHGKAEQVMVWRDETTGVMRRAMLDWLPDKVEGKRTILVDYKTAASADPGKFARSAADYGYHQQDDWYRTGLTAVRGDEDPAFVFVVQEKVAPYLVTVVELDEPAKRMGRERNERALRIYAECTRTNTWPGYADDVALVSLPRYAEIAHEELMSA